MRLDICRVVDQNLHIQVGDLLSRYDYASHINSEMTSVHHCSSQVDRISEILPVNDLESLDEGLNNVSAGSDDELAADP